MLGEPSFDVLRSNSLRSRDGFKFSKESRATLITGKRDDGDRKAYVHARRIEIQVQILSADGEISPKHKSYRKNFFFYTLRRWNWFLCFAVSVCEQIHRANKAWKRRRGREKSIAWHLTQIVRWINCKRRICDFIVNKLIGNDYQGFSVSFNLPLRARPIVAFQSIGIFFNNPETFQLTSTPKRLSILKQLIRSEYFRLLLPLIRRWKVFRAMAFDSRALVSSQACSTDS